jgi:arabinogalactan oligomer/maltooligosaccharide transport system substrate-binding protein
MVGRRLRLMGLILPLLFVLAACVSAPPAPTPPATPAPGATPTGPATPVAPPTPGPLTLVYWEEETDTGDVLLDELAAEFMRQNPDIKVVRGHFEYDELSLLFRSAASREGEQTPDLVRAPGEFTEPFATLGIVVPADEVADRQTLDAFLPGALETARVDGRTWGLPDNYGDHLMLIYNRDLVDGPPADTDAWIAQLKTLTDPAAGRYGLVYNMAEPFWLVPWIGGFGGWVVDAEGNPTLATAAVEDALRFVQDLKLVHRVVPDAADYESAYELFRSGRAAYIIDGAWNLDRYTGSGLSLGVTSLPAVSQTGRLPTPMASGKVWFVSAHPEGPRHEAAMRFARFMTSAAAQQAWLTRMGRLPSDSLTAAEGAAGGTDPPLAGMLAQLRHTRGLPPAQQMPCVWPAMGPELAVVMAGSQTPAAAASAMQAAAESCIVEMAGPATPEPATP